MAINSLRLTVSRSNRFLYAQISDPKTGKVVLGALDSSSLPAEAVRQPRSERAKIFGQEFARQAIAKKVKKVIFDRAGYRYHGIVKAFAQGAREGGLEL